MRLSGLCSTLALVVALLLAPVVAAGDDESHQLDLHFGPIIGGQDLHFDLRTTSNSSLVAVFFGIDGTPTVVPFWPPIGMDVATAQVRLIPTDAAGNVQVKLPTTPGQFGAAGLGLPLFFQAFTENPFGVRIASETVAVEIEPLPFVPGFLSDEASTRLPVGYDQTGADWVEPADIDRDGDADLILATETEVYIWVNDGSGHFVDETTSRIPWSTEAVSTIMVADLNGDGAPDLLTGGGFDDVVSIGDRLWLNDGAGHFSDSGALPVGDGLTSRFEVADLDGNGLVDILLANGAENHLPTAGGKDKLYYNFSVGFTPVFVEDNAFTTAAWNDASTETLTMQAGDVDRDGDLDLFIGKNDTLAVDGTPGQPNLLLLNDGGTFTDATLTNILPFSRSDNTQDAVLVDIDGDFDLDIVVANSVLSVLAPDSNDLLINQGGDQGGIEGVFVDNAGSFLETNTAADGIRLKVHAEDIDLDGDKDILMSVHDLFLGADQALYMNQGGAQLGTEGAFVREFWFDPPFAGSGGLGDFISRDAAVFDADSDGDRDIVILANGVISGDPAEELTVRFLINSKL